MTLVLGIGGTLGSGKDTVADFLVEEYGFVKLGMSDPLAEALSILNPRVAIDDLSTVSDSVKQNFEEGKLYRYRDILDAVGYVDAKTVAEIRTWLQVLGTEVGRNILHEDVWVWAAEKKIRALSEAGKRVVLTGVRFPNEVELLRRNQYASLYVSRPGYQGGTHPSETSLSSADFDLHINNDGSLSDLYQKVRQLMSTLEKTE